MKFYIALSLVPILLLVAWVVLTHKPLPTDYTRKTDELDVHDDPEEL